MCNSITLMSSQCIIDKYLHHKVMNVSITFSHVDLFLKLEV